VQAIAGLLQLIRINASAGVAFSGLLATQLEDGSHEMPAQSVLEVAALLRTHLLNCTVSRQKATRKAGATSAPEDAGAASTSKRQRGGKGLSDAGEDAAAAEPDVAAMEAKLPKGSRATQPNKRKGAAKRVAAESVDAPEEESPEDWAMIMAAVAELCGRLCAMPREAAREREGREAAQEREGREAAAANAASPRRKGGRKRKGRKQVEAEERDEEELFTVEEVVPEGCLLALLEKAPNTQVWSVSWPCRRMLRILALSACISTLVQIGVCIC
jgi:hypothetical protein